MPHLSLSLADLTPGLNSRLPQSSYLLALALSCALLFSQIHASSSVQSQRLLHRKILFCLLGPPQGSLGSFIMFITTVIHN